jgi:hypothetical protein
MAHASGFAAFCLFCWAVDQVDSSGAYVTSGAGAMVKTTDQVRVSRIHSLAFKPPLSPFLEKNFFFPFFSTLWSAQRRTAPA